ncbi:MAG TPA: TIGR03118 family protein [Bryobacteraceae bacterium]|jgi:uncharacterized protein (TIGR03118 family)|nr:TIGR03118 family protein [Bryobacteraceae bacterium]
MKTLLLATCTLLVFQTSLLFSDSLVYSQVNLVANTPGVAAQTDPNLINPWGMSFSATSPFWVSNQGSNTATLYNGVGTATPLVVTVPPTMSGPQGPTGQVQNSAPAGSFAVGTGGAASFLFDTLSGEIAGWNGAAGTTAIVATTTAGASYTGLALAQVGTSSYLYAANFAATGGGINVFDSNFNAVNGTTFANKFKDPSIPSGYAPYNIQLVGNDLYVEYAEVGSRGSVTGAGLGYVDVYDTSGNLISSLIAGGHLNSPWGVTLAPSSFGLFSNDLLVGNFGDGTINAYNPNTGAYIGTISDTNGHAIVLPDLWAIDFRSSAFTSGVPNALYFDAGIDNQTGGLFGYVEPSPEPATYGLGLVGAGALLAMVLFSRRRSAVKT